MSEPVDRDDVRAEAASIVETFNEAAAEYSPELSWFGMTSTGPNWDPQEGFVFDAESYIDPRGVAALQEHDREIAYVEAYTTEGDGEPYVSIVYPVTGEVVGDAEVVDDV